jgi:hypothetical protein
VDKVTIEELRSALEEQRERLARSDRRRNWIVAGVFVACQLALILSGLLK